jgi:Gpi18-like mannosyltransferase
MADGLALDCKYYWVAARISFITSLFDDNVLTVIPSSFIIISHHHHHQSSSSSAAAAVVVVVALYSTIQPRVDENRDTIY